MKIWYPFFSCFSVCLCNIIYKRKVIKSSKQVYISLRDALRIIRTKTLLIQSSKIMKKEKRMQEAAHSFKGIKVKKENRNWCENNEEEEEEEEEVELQIVRIIKDYEKKWSNLQVSKNDLQLKYCFLIGQEFCYKEIMENMYIGLVKNCVFLFKQTEDTILYQCLYDSKMIYTETCKDLALKQNSVDGYGSMLSEDLYIKELFEFFNLHFPLHEHIEIWKKDKRMKEIADTLKGLRLLKLDPRESFFSFICSSNNNIPRITLMNECLRKRYGNHIATIIFNGRDIFVKRKKVFDTKKEITSGSIYVKQEKEEDKDTLCKDKILYYIAPVKNESNNVQIKKEKQDIKIHNIKREALQKDTNPQNRKMEVTDAEIEKDISKTDEKLFYQLIKKERKKETDTKIYSFYEFPTIETLSKLEEKNLRDMGFGYRSAFIINSAKMLNNCGADKWLQDLKKEQNTIDCIKKLLQFPGVGLKVANCICLFGLHRYDCIPIDTHIYDIIYKYYKHLIDELETTTPRNKKSSRNNMDNKHGKNIKKRKSVRGRKNSVDIGIIKSTKHTVSTKKTLLNKEKKKALTHTVYAKLFKKLKNIFGPNCGWAQTMLFTAELKKFSDTFT